MDFLEDKLNHLPEEPGIYKYFNFKNQVIYVGKAKNIKKRVKSYFKSDSLSTKTSQLVSHITNIEYVVVNSEHDALILENQLIKELQPKYNINLKDDKTFPYIAIKKEPFPRVIFTRNKKNDGAEYLGPFTNVLATRFFFDFIKEVYPLRTCNLNLSESKIKQKKYQVCLEFHIKKCKGPCQALQTEENYNQNIQEIKWLMKGNFKEILNDLTEKMWQAATEMRFEQAQDLKNKINLIKNFDVKNSIEVSSNLNIDIWVADFLNTLGIVHLMQIRNGKIAANQNFQVETKLEENLTDVLTFTITQFYLKEPIQVSEIVVATPIEYWDKKINITVPQKGDKKILLDLAIKNLYYTKLEIRRLKMNFDETIDHNKTILLENVQKDLYLQTLPVYIECFDNSNFQGSYPVSAMVCFKNGVPFKNGYRLFKIKNVKGIDDFATMHETVLRRYKKLKEEEAILPNLIIIDGGKGQLNAALDALQKLELQDQMTVIGLAKNEEEIFFSKDKESLKLNYNSKSHQFIRQIRDEVHRFGLAFHRKLRTQGTVKTELSNINGIGEKLALKLLKHFVSVKQIKEQNELELSKIIGPSKAKLIKQYFDKN